MRTTMARRLLLALLLRLERTRVGRISSTPEPIRTRKQAARRNRSTCRVERRRQGSEIRPDKHRHGKTKRETRPHQAIAPPPGSLSEDTHTHAQVRSTHEINHKVTAGRRAMGMEVERLTQQDTMQGALDKVLEKIGESDRDVG